MFIYDALEQGSLAIKFFWAYKLMFRTKLINKWAKNKDLQTTLKLPLPDLTDYESESGLHIKVCQ